MITSSESVINVFIEKTQRDKDFIELLAASLRKAKSVARQQLDSTLFKALPWPTDLSGYHQYLLEFAKWIPQQSSDDAWKIPGTGGFQEVSDRLAHFYWLIDQEVGTGNTTSLKRSRGSVNG